MKVILRDDVEKVGRAGEIVEVSPGYARNFLVARKLAFIATKDNVLRAEAEKRRRAQEILARVQSMKELARALEGRSVTIRARANEEQKLFGSVGPEEVAQGLKAEHGAAVTPSQVDLADHLRELGVFDVRLRLADDVEATVKVWIVPQE